MSSLTFSNRRDLSRTSARSKARGAGAAGPLTFGGGAADPYADMVWTNGGYVTKERFAEIQKISSALQTQRQRVTNSGAVSWKGMVG